MEKKIKLAVFALALISSIQRISSSVCHEHLDLDDYTESYYSYYRPRPRVFSSTLICYNISSARSLPFPPFYQHNFQLYEQNLNITNSNISTLQKEVFENLKHLHSLRLSGIHIKFIEPNAFYGLSNLKKLYLDNNELTELKQDVFLGLDQLNFIDLSRNKIQKIESEVFANLHYSLEVHLEYNLIFRLTNDPFKSITYLDLSGNPLEKTPAIQADILKLKNISLTSDRFDVAFFRPLIHNLDLSWNQLTFFNFSMVSHQIRFLNLSCNKISIINFDSPYLINLLEFDIGDNKIKNFKVSNVIISELNLNRNKIEALDNSSFEISEHATELYLAYNEISFLAKDVFSKLTKLYKLHLANNKITEIPNGFFKNLIHLEILDLSCNKIQKLQFGTFEGLSSLQVLNISNNNLIDLNPGILHPLQSMESLDFSSNRISSFDVEYFYELKTIYLDRNPWTCEELVSVTRRFSSQGKRVPAGETFDVENHNGIACFVQGEIYETNGTVSEFSFSKISQYVQKIINDNVLNSEMNSFLYQNLTKMKVFQELSETNQNGKFNDKPFIVVSVVQIIVFCLLLLLACCIYVIWKKLILKHKKEKVASRLELVISE